MFLDYLYELPNATEGLDNILVQTASEVNSFIPMLIVSTYLIIFLGGITRQFIKIGTADYPMWSTVASLGTLLVTLLLSVTSGFINLSWLITVVVLTIFSGMWFFLDRRQSEV